MKIKLLLLITIMSIFGAKAQTAWTNVGNGLQQRVVSGNTEYRFVKNAGYAPFGVTDSLNLKVNLSSSYSNPSFITSLAYGKLTGTPTIPTASNYVVNGTSLQTSSNFNISGNGKVGTLTISTTPVDKVGTTAEVLVRNSTTGAIEKLNGDNSTYIRGNGILAGFESAVRSTFLNGMVAGTNTPIVTSNSVITAFANLQAQISSLPTDANLLHLTGNETKTGRLTLATPTASAGSAGLSPLIVTGGKAGANTTTSGTVTSGTAADINMTGGAGGDISGITSGTGISGSGAKINLTGGDGGNILGTPTTPVPGNGGSVIAQGGGSYGGIPGSAQLKGGNNYTLGGSGADVYLVPGWGNNSSASNASYDGTMWLGFSPGGTTRGNVVIGAMIDDRTNRLQVTGNAKVTGNIIISTAPTTGDHAANKDYVDSKIGTSGTYTPVISGASNVSSSSNSYGFYTRLGNIVTVTGTVSINQTAANTATLFNFSLPIASDFLTEYNGVGYSTPSGGNDYSTVGTIYSEQVDNVGRVTFRSVVSGSNTINYTFTYSVL